LSLAYSLAVVSFDNSEQKDEIYRFS